MIIEFIKTVTFSSFDPLTYKRKTIKTYNIGDRITATHDNGQYFVTAMGGIYHNEAKRI